MFGASSELASVMEFGFIRVIVAEYRATRICFTATRRRDRRNRRRYTNSQSPRTRRGISRVSASATDRNCVTGEPSRTRRPTTRNLDETSCSEFRTCSSANVAGNATQPGAERTRQRAIRGPTSLATST